MPPRVAHSVTTTGGECECGGSRDLCGDRVDAERREAVLLVEDTSKGSLREQRVTCFPALSAKSVGGASNKQMCNSG